MIARTSARPPWMERPRRAQLTAKVVIFGMILVAVIYPFLSVIATSLASQQDVDAGGGMVLLPLHPSLEAYASIFQGGVISRAIVVSVAITTVGTLLSVAVTTGLAYGLSRPTVRQAIGLMALHDVSQLPVMDGANCVGSVSDWSLSQKSLENPKLLDTTVSEIMDSPFPMVASDQPVDSVVKLLSKANPAVLVQEHGVVQGIVTRSDMLHFMMSR